LQMRISETLGRNTTAYLQVKDLRARLKDFTKRPAQDPVAVAAAQLETKASALQGESITIFDTPKNSFITVNDSLVSLIALVDGADFAPSEESFAAEQRMCVSMNAALEEWQQLKAKDLAGFNQLLEQQKLNTVPSYPEVSADASCRK
jgi:hypothetical protein